VAKKVEQIIDHLLNTSSHETDIVTLTETFCLTYLHSIFVRLMLKRINTSALQYILLHVIYIGYVDARNKCNFVLL